MGPPPINSYRNSVLRTDDSFLEYMDRNTSVITSKKQEQPPPGSTRYGEQSTYSLRDTVTAPTLKEQTESALERSKRRLDSENSRGRGRLNAFDRVDT